MNANGTNSVTQYRRDDITPGARIPVLRAAMRPGAVCAAHLQVGHVMLANAEAWLWKNIPVGHFGEIEPSL